MTSLKVTYFDLAGSRGEEVRLALCIAGQDFDDNRIARDAYPAIRREMPFASLPVLEVEGHGAFGQSNAILRLIGRLHGLYPEDIYEAARHDAVMDAVEDLRHKVSPTLFMKDPEQRKVARQQIAADFIPVWGNCIERAIGEGPFVSGAKPGVADIKLCMVDRWISNGSLDDIPSDVLDSFVKLKAVAAGIKAHPAVIAWYARSK